ncbi:hypothetical protein [Helicobacter pylori]|uniref:hypothetical protein n=2 Tax=Helicobacter pylori TaxID=210 RepID=UPI001EE84D88|nr:hypothetical protein [Helicobacter pylori]
MSGIPYIFIKASNWFDDFKKSNCWKLSQMDSSVFLDALDIGYSFNAKLLWTLADVGERLIQSPCSGFVKKIMNSYLVEVTQDTLKTIKRTTATQSGTESIFLYLLTQTLLNLTQHADIKGLSNKTRS